MHVFGHPVDVDGLLGIVHDFGVPMVEDAAESLGSFYQGVHTGTFGLLGTLSFNGNKTITTGGGGAILTNDAQLARAAKHLTTTAKVAHRWEYRHDQIGFNYRLPNLNAALGCAQLEQLPDCWPRSAAFTSATRRRLPRCPEYGWSLNPQLAAATIGFKRCLLDHALAGERDEVLALSNDAGFMTRPIWVLNHRLPAFRDSPRMPLPVAESLEQRVVNVPSSAQLAMEPVQ